MNDPRSGFCFNCNDAGHIARDCSKPTRRGPGRVEIPPVPPRKPASEIADYAAAARRARKLLGYPLPEDVPQCTRMDENVPQSLRR